MASGGHCPFLMAAFGRPVFLATPDLGCESCPPLSQGTSPFLLWLPFPIPEVLPALPLTSPEGLNPRGGIGM